MSAALELDEGAVPVDGVSEHDSVPSDGSERMDVYAAVVVEQTEVEEYFWPDGEPFADFDVPMGHLSAPISWTVGYVSETIQEAAEKGSAWARRRLGLPVLPRRGSMALRPFVAALADLLVASILKDRAAE